MSQSPGARIGPYEIIEAIGAGGMGEVFRARDTRLNRDVAIKVLPAAFAQDKERVARFRREAQVVASLNHSHIAAIHGLEESDGGVLALALEFVEGEDLAQRLMRGAIPIDEAIDFARQIAEGLEAAHEKGIVHRDLKPANIKITSGGVVKILDFGLAKAFEGDLASSDASLANSPTMAQPMTGAGMILGTAAYMSPEQARGKTVDKRSDIWAFGVVLSEMLTGTRLFPGETVSDTLAAVLRQEVDFDTFPQATPHAIRRLLRRCLERNPRNRLHDIADARLELMSATDGRIEEAPATPAPVTARRGWWRALPWLLVAALTAVVVAHLARAPAAHPADSQRALEFSVPLGRLLADDAQLAFAPDGGSIVFTALDPALGPQLWLRRLDRFDAVPLHGTVGATFPFWSLDGRSIGFFRDSDASLCRYDLATATVEVLSRIESGGRGAAWGSDGTVLFAASSNGPLRRLAATGGAVTDVTVLDPKVPDGSHRFPILLPDGRHFLFTFWTNQLEAANRVGGIYLGSFEKGIVRRLTPDLSQAFLVGRDRILVRRAGALVALPFDSETFAITGIGEKVVEQPRYSAASGALSASATAAGDLAYALASEQTGGELVWLDREGKKTGTFGSERLRVRRLALAPDGRSFAAQAISASGQNVWVGDARRQVINRLTVDAIDANDPVWSPDGKRIAFTTQAEGSNSIYVQEADGSRPAELLLSKPDRGFTPTKWSANGRYLLLQSSAKGQAKSDLWLYDFEANSARELLSDRAASLSEATLSDDGRWLAYVSDESGNPEIFVRPFPTLDRKWKISQGGALQPHWRGDGRELLFVGLADRAVAAVDVAPSRDGLEVGIPHRLFAPASQLLGLAPAADHSRFLAGIIPGDVRTEPIRVLLGWRASGSGGKP